MALEAGKLIIERGGKAVFSSRTQAKVDKVLKDIGVPERAFGAVCDAGKVEDISRLLQKAKELMGGVDALMYGPTSTEVS